MIFITVGTQLPFDRLISLVEEWVASKNFEINVNAQIGNSGYKSEILTVFNDIPPNEFLDLFKSSSVIVAHAGMGSILTALKFNKPIIIFPRLASLGEHRNDHQLATVNSFKDTPGVYVATNKEQLFSFLDNSENLVPGSVVSSQEYNNLIKFLENYKF